MTIPQRYLLYIPALIGAGMFVSCRNEIREIEAVTGDQKLAVQTTINASYRYTELGKLKNTLKAGKLERFTGDESRVEVSEGFELVIYDSLETAEAYIQAQSGVMLEAENTLIARDDVRVYNTEGDTLLTEELIWLQDSARIYSEKLVTIVSEKGTLQGRGFESNESFSRYSIKNLVGEIPIPPDSTASEQ